MLRKACIVLSLLAAVPLAVSFAAAAETPRELVVAYTPRRVNLDPLHTFTSMESQFFTAIYEGLLINNPYTLEPMPAVARSWQVSDDGKVYRFTLRPEALYSNGDAVRAQDFVDSWLRMLDPRAAAEYSFLFDVIKGARSFRTGALKDSAQVGVRAVSDSLLEVELEAPAPHFLKLLCHISFLPLHPSLARRTGWDDAKSVIGNGPFSITARTSSEIELSKNPRYWDAARVGLDRIRVVFIEDPAKATSDYLSGKIDWSTFGDINAQVSPDKVEAFPMFGTTFFFFACDAPPWNDWRVRRGLALLLPWDELRGTDFVFPTDTLIPLIPSYPELKGISAAQSAEGRRLLAEAGFTQGRKLPQLVIKVFDDSVGAEAAQKMAEAWKRLADVDVVVKPILSDDYWDELKKRDYAMAISTWIGDYADPLTFLQLWDSGSNLNDARFSDASYDAAVFEALSIADTEKRYRRLADAEEILLSKAVILPLGNSAAVHLIDLNRIDGWFGNPLDLHPFKFLKFKVRKPPAGVAEGDIGAVLD